MKKPDNRAGIALALGSDAAFIGLAVLIAFSAPLGALTIAALRIVVAFPLLLMLLLFAAPAEAIGLVSRNSREWGIGCLTALILGTNMVLFASAPLWGEAEGVAQGYLFLPVCLASLDLSRGEVRSNGLLCGLALATLGIAHSIVRSSHFSWVALYIGVSMTLYFELHKRSGLTLLQRAVSDCGLLMPFGCAALAWRSDFSLIREYWPAAAGLGAISTAACVCYLGASKALSHTAFGILSLLEPVGFAVIAIVLYHKHMSYIDLGLMLTGAALVLSA